MFTHIPALAQIAIVGGFGITFAAGLLGFREERSRRSSWERRNA